MPQTPSPSSRRALAASRTIGREARHQAIIDALVDGLIVRDGEGALLDANPAALALVGLSEDQLREATHLVSATGRMSVVYEDGTPAAPDHARALLGFPPPGPVRHLLLGLRRSYAVRWVLVSAQKVGLGPREVAVTSLVDVTTWANGLHALAVLHPSPVRSVEQAMRQQTPGSRLLPICMHCKGIRNDDGDWEPLETYFSTRAAVLFSHGLCPTCEAQHYGPSRR